MAAPTRMLLLGAVAIFEPVNGYQVRRELLSWRVDEWAATLPGSIYHGLARLAADGLLRRHDVDDGGRSVAVYETTPAGQEDLRTRVRAGLADYDPFDDATFQAAFGLLLHLPPDEVLDALRQRRAGLVEALATRLTAHPDQAPPHARRGLELWRAHAEAEQAWLEETIAMVERGDLPGTWTPPDDDPGWQMQRDRERYRALLRNGSSPER